MAFLYNLISCEQENWNSEFNLCSGTEYLNDGEIVFISGTPSQTFKIILVGNPVDCTGFDPLPSIVGTGVFLCGDGYEYFNLTNCQTGEQRKARFLMGELTPFDLSLSCSYLQCNFGAISLDSDTCGGWSAQFTDNKSFPYSTETIVQQFSDCATALASFGICDFSERTEFDIGFVVLPELESGGVDNRAFKVGCCYENTVLASSTDDSTYKNDFSGFYFQKQNITDSCTFVLIDNSGVEHLISNSDYGVFADFGQLFKNLNLTYFVAEWRKIILSLGVGCYKVRKDVVIGGVSFSEDCGQFTLREFSVSSSDYTIRIEGNMGGQLEKDGSIDSFTTSTSFNE